jgi:dual specificity MAP kinase phosphatase
MTTFLHKIHKNSGILRRRLATQGVRTTLIWAYGRAIPLLTGVPMLRYGQVTPQLYVGSQFNARGMRALIAQGFVGCINMRLEKDDAAHGLALPRYLYLPTVDDQAPSIEHLDMGVAFIREVIEAGGKVYIHCGAGVGRAPTMAAAYLLAEGHTLEQALALIRQARPFIAITPPQMEQLERYARRCLENSPEIPSSQAETAA